MRSKSELFGEDEHSKFGQVEVPSQSKLQTESNLLESGERLDDQSRAGLRCQPKSSRPVGERQSAATKLRCQLVTTNHKSLINRPSSDYINTAMKCCGQRTK